MADGRASAIAASHARFKCDMSSHGADCARHMFTNIGHGLMGSTWVSSRLSCERFGDVDFGHDRRFG
jgi:hypothetical protein